LVGGMLDAEINNVIYMELYSGPMIALDKYEKTNVARSIDRDSTVSATLRTSHFLCSLWFQSNFYILDFKLLPCSECHVLSCG
jgi:hypothetical protein